MPSTRQQARSPIRFSSLRTALIVPYISLLLLLTLLLTALFYWTGTRAVAKLSDQLLVEMVQRIRLSVDQHMFGSSAVLEVAFPTGLSAPKSIESDWENLYRRFWAATAIHTEPNDYVYYGNIQGQGFGMKRLDNNTVELRVKTREQDHRQYYRVQGIHGTPTPMHLEANLFDPRTRPWFTLGEKANRHTWTSVYINFGLRDLVVTRARRVESNAGQFEGVVATDVSLHELETFIRQLSLTDDSHAFIVEPNGNLIASSRIASLRDRADGSLSRVNAQDGLDPTIATVYQALLPVFAQTTQPQQQARTMTVKGPEGETLHVALTRIRDDAGLDWIAVIAVPARDLLGGITRSLIGSLLLGMLAAALLAAFGLRFFHRVAADISELSLAARKVGRGDLDVDLHINRNDEVGELARSFKTMHSDLFTDRLTGAANRSALMQLLESTLEQAARQPTAFALLFLDLNGFKPLNDRYGHDNGDQALREIAQRLRQAVRADDLVARLGGDEFVVLLRHVPDQATAQAIGDQIQQAVRAPLTTLQVPANTNVTVGCALGIALYPQDGLDAASLLNHADQAMYRNKAGQR